MFSCTPVVCIPQVKDQWDPWHFTTIWDSKACYRNSFTFTAKPEGSTWLMTKPATWYNPGPVPSSSQPLSLRSIVLTNNLSVEDKTSLWRVGTSLQGIHHVSEYCSLTRLPVCSVSTLQKWKEGTLNYFDKEWGGNLRIQTQTPDSVVTFTYPGARRRMEPK
jgi:hypothetical protein